MFAFNLFPLLLFWCSIQFLSFCFFKIIFRILELFLLRNSQCWQVYCLLFFLSFFDILSQVCVIIILFLFLFYGLYFWVLLISNSVRVQSILQRKLSWYLFYCLHWFQKVFLFFYSFLSYCFSISKIYKYLRILEENYTAPNIS